MKMVEDSLQHNSGDDAKFIREFRGAERDYMALGLHVSELVENRDQINADLKFAMELQQAKAIQLRSLMRRAESVPGLLDSKYGDPIPPPEMGEDVAGVLQKKFPPRKAGVHVTPISLPPKVWEPKATTATHWRYASVEELELETISGLGSSKRVRLVEGIPTIGDLEDIRVEAAKHFQPVHRFFPQPKMKGIGEGVGNELTDRLIRWLSRNRDAAPMVTMSESVQSSVSEHVADESTSTVSAAEQVDLFGDLFDDIGTNPPETSEAAKQPEPSQSSAYSDDPEYPIREEYQTLSQGRMEYSDSTDFGMGFSSYKDNQPVINCPHSSAGSRRTLWLMGYVYAEQGQELQ